MHTQELNQMTLPLTFRNNEWDTDWGRIKQFKKAEVHQLTL